MFGSGRGTATESRAIGKGSIPWGSWSDDDWTADVSSGVSVSNRSAMQTLAVHGCARFIADGIATLPVDVFRGTGADRVEVRKPAWLEQPTADLAYVDWITQLLVSLLLDGNALTRKVFSGGLLTELPPFDPDAVSVGRVKGRRAYFVNGQQIDSNEILHIPGFMYPGADVGLSPVEAARQTVGRGVAIEQFAGRFFTQGANMSGVIEDPEPPNATKAKETARIFAKLHSGLRKAHLPGVLMGGATWKPAGVTNEQSQFLQTHQFTQAQIASFMFLIDPTEFGVSFDKGSSITYANLVQRNQRKAQVTFLPWIVRIERALSALLPRPQYVKINLDGLLRAEAKARWEMYEIASRINTAAQQQGMKPVMLTDEMRELEDWRPVDGFDFPTPDAATAAQTMPDLSLIQGAQ